MMNDHLNILVLHRLGEPRKWRSAVAELEHMLPTYAPDHHYFVHPVEIPLPPYVKDVPFHGIVMGPTFLGSRRNKSLHKQLLREYEFVKHSAAFKIAMPQDEYDCSAILDDWMTDWKMDVVYSVCSGGWDVLYPSYSLAGEIRTGFTGYVSDHLIESWHDPKPFEERSIDVSYRSHRIHGRFGRLGYEKANIGDIFRRYALGHGLTLDISTSANDMIPGDRWREFLEDSKFCLVANSGSSLLDPYGSIRACVTEYVSHFPNATKEEVEAACYPGRDGEFVCTAISPRNIEAALAMTVQIAIPGEYSGIMQPWRDYIPFEVDGSNFADVIRVMRDVQEARRIAARCKESVLSVDALRYRNHARELIERIRHGVFTRACHETHKYSISAAVKRYKKYRARKLWLFWSLKRASSRFASTIQSLPKGR